ncbi:MAG: hypothetical protein A2Z83_06875 [Omnitrophica bacterium GWA2_52_8]|nr:MAG: hypothetical protein A2Z83_06875 [Omnitrophica bacterium GWA2_52_8]
MMQVPLLNIIRCPETKQPLHPAEKEFLAKLNQGISSGLVKNKKGETVSRKIDGGFIRKDAKSCFPVRNGIVTLLSKEAILLSAV